MRREWTVSEAKELYNLPFSDLVYTAQQVYREHFNPNVIQISTLLSIKTGRCPEDCAYCPQSAHYQTGLEKNPLMQLDEVKAAARRALDTGSSRFCMGAAWRAPHDRDLGTVCEMIAEVKKMGLETCVTLGMLKPHQAEQLKTAGLDFYNHNVDTSEEYYSKIITTREFSDRLDTLQHVRDAGISVCCGGILGMGETADDRISMLVLLANMDPPPESIPINQLIAIPGTPMANADPIDPFDFVRTLALARILAPKAWVRLSAGREQMSDEMQALCFLAGANSIFYGEKLLTAANPAPEKDIRLFERLGLTGLQ